MAEIIAPGPAARAGELQSRPAPGARPAPAAGGLRTLGPEGPKRTLLYVPDGYDPVRPAPLMVFLHGAGGDAGHTLPAFSDRAEAAGIILLAPSSRGATWDVIRGGFGPDVAAIDRALDEVFTDYSVDPARVAAAGFSDGASYALSLGLGNGELFTHIVAFSPGFVASPRRQGSPSVYISHGVADAVLPVGPCSRRIVPALEHQGYDVRYHEFPDGHTIPAEIASGAFAWFVEGGR
ncbi:alpha/beta hydrolase [Arenibaculum pallidiluteum]|uniref:alpha/beta hydrolase n=1 Tax=Arenibaculum pallidiluteum TaxID=2812559 RepID=UPI001A9623E9|nr:hypothetical protein [Arenibaculum pallidiluteum]